MYIERTRDVRSTRSAPHRTTFALVSGRSKVALVDGDSPHLTGQARGRLRCRAAHLRADGGWCRFRFSGTEVVCVCVCVCVMLLGGAVLLATMLPALGWRRARGLPFGGFLSIIATHSPSSPLSSPPSYHPSSPSLRVVSFASPFSRSYCLLACLQLPPAFCARS